MPGRCDPPEGYLGIITGCIAGLVGRNTSTVMMGITARGRLIQQADLAEFNLDDKAGTVLPLQSEATTSSSPTSIEMMGRISEEGGPLQSVGRVALGIECNRPIAKSTLQVFRSQLILARPGALKFDVQPEAGPGVGVPEEADHEVALDTTNILGRGAVRDTYNLLGDGIVKLLRRCRRLRESASAMGPGPTSLAIPMIPGDIPGPQGEQRPRLVRPAGADALLACGRRGPAAGVVAAGAGGIARELR